MSNLGYRFWNVGDDGRLLSPFAGNPLPDDGMAVAHCPRHPAPGLACQCGISYYSTSDDIRRAITAFPIMPEGAVTIGEIGWPVMPNNRPQLYFDSLDIPMVGPPAMRARTYTLRAIYTERNMPNIYTVPMVRALDDLKTVIQ